MTKALQIHTSSLPGSSPVHGSIYEFLGYGTGRYCSDVWLTCTDIFIAAFTFTVEYMWAESPCSMYIGHMHKAVSHRNERFCSRSPLTIANLAIRPQRAKQWIGWQQIFDVCRLEKAVEEQISSLPCLSGSCDSVAELWACWQRALPLSLHSFIPPFPALGRFCTTSL